MNRPATSPRELSVWRRMRIVAVRSVTEWFDLRCSSKGAAVAFYTLFSMAPILILALAVAGSLFGQQAARGEIFAQLHGLLGPVGAQAIEALLVNAHNPDVSHIATAIASVFLLIGTTTIFAELKESLDEIWHVPSVRQSGLWHLLRIRLLSFGLVIVLVFLLLVSLLLWIYYSAQIFFLGAGFTRQYALWFGTMQQHADMRDAD